MLNQLDFPYTLPHQRNLYQPTNVQTSIENEIAGAVLSAKCQLRSHSTQETPGAGERPANRSKNGQDTHSKNCVKSGIQRATQCL